MSDDPEPPENISGGPDGGGAAAAFEPGEHGDGSEPESRADAVVERLGELYWQKTYGGKNAFECLVRTILSQNTSDVVSQPAHDALLERYNHDGDLAKALADADTDELASIIQPAGLQNQKSRVITEAAQRVVEEFGGEDTFDEFVREDDYNEVRETLLDFSGVGPKTADCVLLFAGGRQGVFPVDTHVHRIYRRLGIAPPDADHEEVREVLEATVPPEKCGFAHTASIQFGREYCSAQQPACLDGLDACPLSDLCDRVGVDPESGEVVDPAEAASTE